jgi:hypothetical protein
MQEALEQAAAVGLVVVFEREAELLQHLEQEFARTEPFAAHRRSHDAFVEVAQQMADQQALAATLRGGNDAKASARPQGVAHEFERAQVLIAGKKESVIDTVAERRFGEAEAALDSAEIRGGLGHMPKGLLQTQTKLADIA